jgi:hypothetical protein
MFLLISSATPRSKLDGMRSVAFLACHSRRESAVAFVFAFPNP